MTLFQNNLLIITLLFFLGGCGIVRHSVRPSGSDPAGSVHTVSNYEEMQASLMQAYRDWKGTPYVLGGISQDGIDCSSFVRVVFDRYFGIKLPTNTRTQLNAGTGVRRKALHTGDLVFFRTGRRTLHVGIIIKGDEFMHASTSSGVMMSRLSDHYWANRYLMARRVM